VLVGFTKVAVAAGAHSTATVVVSMDDVGRYDPYARLWVVDPGKYTLFAQECAGSGWDGYLTQGAPTWPGGVASGVEGVGGAESVESVGTGCAVAGSVTVIVE
jgi:hypothetical protein